MIESKFYCMYNIDFMTRVYGQTAAHVDITLHERTSLIADPLRHFND